MYNIIILGWHATIVEMMLSLETITIEGLRGRGCNMGGLVVAHACIPPPPFTLNIPCFPEIQRKVHGRVVARGIHRNRRVSMGSDRLLLLLLLL